MEMEISLQDYVDVVLQHWPVVLAVFLAATVVATAVSFLQPSIYEASTTLVEESYEFFGTPRLSSRDRTVIKLYPTLVKSAAVENAVVEALESSLSAAEKAPGALLAMVTLVEDRDDPALFHIKVRADDRNKAVQIANAWAEQYVHIASSFEADWSSQLGVVERRLESTEEALASFAQVTGLGLVEDSGGDDALIVLGARGVELQGKLLSLAEHRQAHDNLLLLLDSAQQAKQAGRGIDDLPLQLLNVPVIVDRGQLSVEFVREQGDLDALAQLLQAEQGIISEVVDELAPEVEQLQGELARDKLELEGLTRARDLAEGAYEALANEMQEAQLFQSRTQILSPAAGSKILGSSPKSTIVLGAALGLAGGILAAFAVHYLQGIQSGAPGGPSQVDDR